MSRIIGVEDVEGAVLDTAPPAPPVHESDAHLIGAYVKVQDGDILNSGLCRIIKLPIAGIYRRTLALARINTDKVLCRRDVIACATVFSPNP